MPGEVIVVRGGARALDIETLRVALDNAMETEGRLELTFFKGLPGETLEDLIERAGAQLGQLRNYSKVRCSTEQKLADAGYDLVDCDRHGHCQIVFDQAPSDEELERLASLFDDPEPNPARRSDR